LNRWNCRLRCFLGLFEIVRRMMLRDGGRRIFLSDVGYTGCLVVQRMLHHFVMPSISFAIKEVHRNVEYLQTKVMGDVFEFHLLMN
jgi:hypothetical protein